MPEITLPRAAEAPAINADPEEPVWEEAASIEELSLSLNGPEDVKDPVPTEVKLLWDEDGIYVRFICQDTEPYAPYDGRDAAHYEGDVVEVFIDPVGDGRQWYEVQVNPDSDILDKLFLLTGEPSSRENGTLDRGSLRQLWTFLDYDIKGLRTAVEHVEEGWIVDIALPAEELMRRRRGNKLRPMKLRANFLRYERPPAKDSAKKRKAVFMNWSPISYGQPHRSPQRMGYLILVE
ncbi:MAG: carbohydrate-binding family 9-like protein [Candidatus Brocadiia bacterium]